MIFVLFLTLLLSTLNALPTPPLPASLSFEEPDALSVKFWTSEGEDNDILQEFLRNERSKEESDISLRFLSDYDYTFDIEFTDGDTERLLDEPLSLIPTPDKTAIVGPKTTAPRPHSEKRKHVQIEMNHSHLDSLKMAYAAGYTAFLNAKVDSSPDELADSAVASKLKTSALKRKRANVIKLQLISGRGLTDF
jgi:hypothetical protein